MKVQKKLISDDLSNSIRKVLILYGKVLLWVGYFIKPLVLEVYSGRNIFYFISSRTFNFNSSNIILFAFDLLTSIFLIPSHQQRVFPVALPPSPDRMAPASTVPPPFAYPS